ncbi:hypothetical protein R3P38DRAFT_2818990 [Favolaschia claudopus]|uniref:Uncharacterized protein n=1 Tax=Favolaschia claudopus TaxID=2862362 RepID=A0AAW0ED15_9AGAR
MSLSVLEAIALLEPLDTGLARFGLLYGPSHAYRNAADSEAKALHKWLDTFASLLKSLPGSPRKQACAVSISLLQSSCTMTVAFNAENKRPETVSDLIHSIWDWMSETSSMQDAEMAGKNRELLIIVIKASLERLRRRLTEKAWFVDPLLAATASSSAPPARKRFLLVVEQSNADLLRLLGPDVESPDSDIVLRALLYWRKEYEDAKTELEQNVYWLAPYERLLRKPGFKPPSLVHHMEKLFQPYMQCLLIRKARKTLRAAHSIPLTVNVLPSPEISLHDRFQLTNKGEARIRAYLASSLHADLTGAASSPHATDAINQVWERIQHLPPPLPLHPAHCESVLLRHHLDNHIHNTAASPYPYFGISKPLCFQCALYFEAYQTCQLGPPFKHRGFPKVKGETKIEVEACTVPICCRGYDVADKAIEEEMGARLEKIFGTLLADTIERLRKAAEPDIVFVLPGYDPDREHAITRLIGARSNGSSYE